MCTALKARLYRQNESWEQPYSAFPVPLSSCWPGASVLWAVNDKCQSHPGSLWVDWACMFHSQRQHFWDLKHLTMLQAVLWLTSFVHLELCIWCDKEMFSWWKLSAQVLAAPCLNWQLSVRYRNRSGCQTAGLTSSSCSLSQPGSQNRSVKPLFGFNGSWKLFRDRRQRSVLECSCFRLFV